MFSKLRERPRNIKILNIDESGRVAVTYLATYADGSEKTVRRVHRDIATYSGYKLLMHTLRVTSAELLGTIFLGFIAHRSELLFLVRFADGTMDIVREPERSQGAGELLAIASKNK